MENPRCCPLINPPEGSKPSPFIDSAGRFACGSAITGRCSAGAHTEGYRNLIDISKLQGYVKWLKHL